MYLFIFSSALQHTYIEGQRDLCTSKQRRTTDEVVYEKE